MIRINQIKLPVGHNEAELKKKISRLLRIDGSRIETIQIQKKSIDARKKPELFMIYTVDVAVRGIREQAIIEKCRSSSISIAPVRKYDFSITGTEPMNHPPVIIGSGPAGLFCGWMLARHGYCPLILERGADVDTRTRDVERFWQTGILSENSNVQFGEGGAGTFSDGKLNTMVKDPLYRNRQVLELFVQAGAPEDILYESKPHIGTDVLRQVVKNLRRQIIEMGGEVRFLSQVTDLRITEGRLTGVEVNHKEWINADCAVLAVGHSARDTFSLLKKHHVVMEAKSFAVGLRMEHPQSMIDCSQYGRTGAGLPPASYKLTRQTSQKRGVYSFCMCPGGYVVNASSEKEGLAVNGMSYHARDSRNANSAIIVTVTPDDFPGTDVLSGVAFQRHLERYAYRLCGGKVPIQLFGDFQAGQESRLLGEVEPCIKGSYEFGSLHTLFPQVLYQSLVEGIQSFEEKIKGFSRYDSILSGVESRTSSPVRILRNEQLESSVTGLIPCGEGAGYAGGITSAAMDGLKAAEAIAGRYRPGNK